MCWSFHCCSEGNSSAVSWFRWSADIHSSPSGSGQSGNSAQTQSASNSVILSFRSPVERLLFYFSVQICVLSFLKKLEVSKMFGLGLSLLKFKSSKREKKETPEKFLSRMSSLWIPSAQAQYPSRKIPETTSDRRPVSGIPVGISEKESPDKEDSPANNQVIKVRFSNFRMTRTIILGLFNKSYKHCRGSMCVKGNFK